MHIQLIGFMCTGKSRIGRELAALLGRPFYDIDRVIEQRVGAIKPFFEREGESAFRSVESQVLGELLAAPPAVIAMGGGTPCEGDNLQRMKAAGTVVWLDVPLEVLMPRIERAGGDRPLLAGLKGEQLRLRVLQLLEPRIPFYAQADIHLNAVGTPTEMAERIAARLQAR
ncbi:MAG: shikimate kinase [Flavobacteriales bacterium]|nr:shikimate kinase [Flavobacteriales bacterium]